MSLSEAVFKQYSLTPSLWQLMEEKDIEINGEIKCNDSAEEPENTPDEVVECNYPRTSPTATTSCTVKKEVTPADKPPTHLPTATSCTVKKEVTPVDKPPSQQVPQNQPAEKPQFKNTVTGQQKGTAQSKQNKQPYVSSGALKDRVLKLNYPRVSRMFQHEQTLYLTLYKKFANQAVPSTEHSHKDLLLFKDIQAKVLAEQKEYMVYLQEVANTCRQEYSNMNLDIDAYTTSVWDNRIARVLNYPRFYVQHDSVPVVAPPAKVVFFHIKTLLNLGSIPRLINIKTKLVAGTKGTIEKKIPPDYPEVAQKPVCSDDNNAKKLSVTHNVNIVISASALSCLVDNHPPFDRQWEMPIVIREEEKLENGAVKKMKVVYFDKPFVPRQMTTRQRNEWGHKFTVKHIVQNNNHLAEFQQKPDEEHRNPLLYSVKSEKGRSPKKRKTKHAGGADEVLVDDPFDSGAIQNLETFGTDSGPVKKLKLFEAQPGDGTKKTGSDLQKSGVTAGESSSGEKSGVTTVVGSGGEKSSVTAVEEELPQSAHLVVTSTGNDDSDSENEELMIDCVDNENQQGQDDEMDEDTVLPQYDGPKDVKKVTTRRRTKTKAGGSHLRSMQGQSDDLSQSNMVDNESSTSNRRSDRLRSGATNTASSSPSGLRTSSVDSAESKSPSKQRRLRGRLARTTAVGQSEAKVQEESTTDTMSTPMTRRSRLVKRKSSTSGESGEMDGEKKQAGGEQLLPGRRVTRKSARTLARVMSHKEGSSDSGSRQSSITDSSQKDPQDTEGDQDSQGTEGDQDSQGTEGDQDSQDTGGYKDPQETDGYKDPQETDTDDDNTLHIAVDDPVPDSADLDPDLKPGDEELRKPQVKDEVAEESLPSNSESQPHTPWRMKNMKLELRDISFDQSTVQDSHVKLDDSDGAEDTEQGPDMSTEDNLSESKDIAEGTDQTHNLMQCIEQDLDISESESDVETGSPRRHVNKRRGLHFSDEEDSEEERRKSAVKAQRQWIASVRKSSEVHTKKKLKSAATAVTAERDDTEQQKKPAVKVKAGLRKVVDDFDIIPTNKPPRKRVPALPIATKQATSVEPTDTSKEIGEVVPWSQVLSQNLPTLPPILAGLDIDTKHCPKSHSEDTGSDVTTLPRQPARVRLRQQSHDYQVIGSGNKKLLQGRSNVTPKPLRTSKLKSELNVVAPVESPQPTLTPLQRGGLSEREDSQSDGDNLRKYLTKRRTSSLADKRSCDEDSGERDLLAPRRRVSYARDRNQPTRTETKSDIAKSFAESQGRKRTRQTFPQPPALGILDQLLPLPQKPVQTGLDGYQGKSHAESAARGSATIKSISQYKKYQRKAAACTKVVSDQSESETNLQSDWWSTVGSEPSLESEFNKSGSEQDLQSGKITACETNREENPAKTTEKEHGKTGGAKSQQKYHMYQAPPHLRDPKEWEMYEEQEGYKCPAEHNVTYNLWQLGHHRVLIRCGIHAARFNPAQPQHQAELLHLQSKLEYQIHHGFEQDTVSEISRAWISLAIRPHCKLLKFRILANSSQVFNIEEVSLEQLAQPKFTFCPQSSFHVLDGIFRKLSSLHPGHYLLGHSPGNTQAHIKKTSQSQVGVYDLHTAYQKLQVLTDVVPWIPIDTTKLTPHQKQNNRIPCTFYPKDSVEGSILFKSKLQFNKKNKKKKKKKPRE